MGELTQQEISSLKGRGLKKQRIKIVLLKVCHPEEPWEAWEADPCEPHEGQQGQEQGRAHGSGQSAVSIQAGGWMDWEQLCGGGVGNTAGWKTR